MKKDCAFQYATSDGHIVENTDLITREEADKLFEKYKPIFKKDLDNGNEPEMALWVNMEDSSGYKETAYHWHYADMIVLNNNLYKLELTE